MAGGKCGHYGGWWSLRLRMPFLQLWLRLRRSVDDAATTAKAVAPADTADAADARLPMWLAARVGGGRDGDPIE